MKETRAERVIDGRYRLIREIARGGAGTVFEAKHQFIERPVCLKLLNVEHQRSPDQQARLLREALALFRARHENVVEVFDAGFCREGHVYLVTELVEGRPLAGLLTARGKLGVRDTLQVAMQLLAALGQAHRAGVVHRDVKPDNVLLNWDSGQSRWQVKLVDFGTARFDGADAKLTRVGEVIGTPEYMSPEQLLDEPLDHRTDVYSLGVTLYECLTGRVPFSGNLGQVVMALSGGEFARIREITPAVPVALATAIERAISRRPGDRFADAASFAEALAAVAPEPSGSAQVGTTRRAHARAPYVTPLRLITEGAEPCDGRTEDISLGGVLVLLDSALDLGSQLRLRFSLPISGKVVDVAAVSKWERDHRGRRAVGLEFVNLPAEAGEAIQRYVELMAPARAS
jgi:serine/threonine-protein kinase